MLMAVFELSHNFIENEQADNYIYIGYGRTTLHGRFKQLGEKEGVWRWCK
jgi:hypothetical protein